MSKRFLLAALAAAAGFGVAGSAAAANFGSAIFSTYRSCAAVSSTTICDGNGPGQQVLFPAGSEFGAPSGPFGPSILSGGDMVSSTGSFTAADGSASSSITFLTANSEPVMSGTVSTTSAPSFSGARTGSNGVAYYTYTNSGGVPVDVQLSASISFELIKRVAFGRRRGEPARRGRIRSLRGDRRSVIPLRSTQRSRLCGLWRRIYARRRLCL